MASFQVQSAVGTDYYSVNANAGDNLHFATTTPAGGPAEFVNNFYPELLLYDPNGNLVAVAAGNASDGRNSVIDFTVPAGDAGRVDHRSHAHRRTRRSPTQGEYGLLVTGATGAPVTFLCDEHHSGPRGSRAAAFDDHCYFQSTWSTLSSLTPGELEVNGVAGHRQSWTSNAQHGRAGPSILECLRDRRRPAECRDDWCRRRRQPGHGH